jgi:hypothetical protein
MKTYEIKARYWCDRTGTKITKRMVVQGSTLKQEHITLESRHEVHDLEVVDHGRRWHTGP